MKKLIQILLFLCITGNLYAQQTANVPQNFTLEKKTKIRTATTSLGGVKDVVTYTDSTIGKSPLWTWFTNRFKFNKIPNTKGYLVSTDKVQVLRGDSLVYIDKDSLDISGSSFVLDTTKVFRVEQGRGSVKAFPYFNGTRWKMNDSSYISEYGTNKLKGDILRTGNGESYFGTINGGKLSWVDTYVDDSIRIQESIVLTPGNSYAGTFINSKYNVATWIASTQGLFGDKTFSFGLSQPFLYTGSRTRYDSTYYNSIKNDSLSGLTKGAADKLYVSSTSFDTTKYIKNTERVTLGENISAGKVMALQPDGYYWLADCRYEGTIKSEIRIAKTTGLAGASIEAYVFGRVPYPSLAAGERYYIGQSGNITYTPTTTVGEFHRYIGANEGVSPYLTLNPDQNYYRVGSGGTYDKINGSDIGGSGGGTLTSVYSANSDIAVDSSVTGKRKITLNKSLTSGYINIGDGTNQAFPRLPSGDWTISNLGVNTLATVNSNVGTFGSATKSTTATVNAKGLVTSISEQTVTPAIGSVTGLGTGVATALGVNVGTAGSVVVNGGALGTPSSGVLTNATGIKITTGITGLQTFDVNDYGATGNGATDDLTAINSAISAAIANGGGNILFRAGTYRVTGTISFLGNNLNIYSANPNTAIFLDFTTVGVTGILLGGNNNKLHDLTIYRAARTPILNAHSVTHQNGLNCEYYNLTIYNSGSFSLFVSSVTNTTNIHIYKCHIYNSSADGIHVQNELATFFTSSIFIYDNTIHDTGDDCIGIGYGGVTTTTDVNIYGNTCYNSGARGIAIMGKTSNIIVNDNIVRDTWLSGIFIECVTGSVGKVSITNNNVSNGGAFTPPTAMNARGGGVGAGILVTPSSTSYLIANINIIGNNISNSWNNHILVGNINDGSAFGNVGNINISNNLCTGIAGVGARGAAAGSGGGFNNLPVPARYAGIFVDYVSTGVIDNNIVNVSNQESIAVGSNCSGVVSIRNNNSVSPNTSAGANYAFAIASGTADVFNNTCNLNGNTVTGNINTSGSTILSVTNNNISSFVNSVVYGSAITGAVPTYTATGTDANIGVTFVPKGTGFFRVTANVNSSNGLVVKNSSTGAAASGLIRVYNSDESLSFSLYHLNSGFTTSGLLVANQSYITTTSNYLGIGATGTSGIFEIMTGGSAAANRRFKIDNFGSITTNTTASSAYRTTNGGTDIAAHMLIDPSNSLTSGTAFGFDATNGIIFTLGNGTRRITGAGIKLVNITTTAGSEVADIGFFPKASGGAIAQALQIGSSAITLSDAVNLVFNSTTGTKIGTATTQRLAFYNSTPIIQPANTVAINAALVNLGLRASGGSSNFTTDIKLDNVGTGLYVKEGINATMGTATLTAGTVTVSTTKVTSNSRIYLSVNGGTLTNVGTPYISARTASTSFTITSTNVLDVSDVAWIIVEPN